MRQTNFFVLLLFVLNGLFLKASPCKRKPYWDFEKAGAVKKFTKKDVLLLRRERHLKFIGALCLEYIKDLNLSGI